MQVNVGDISIECIRGDITNQAEFNAIVNAANAQLRTGGGVAGAIHRAAGKELERACGPLAPIRPGQAVITKAFKLPNDYVIHCLGPVYGQDEPSDRLLADCYRNALELAEDNGLRSVVFPALSTGAFGYPMGEAAEVALTTLVDAASGLKNVRRIRFALFGKDALDAHEKMLRQLAVQGKARES